MVSASIHKKVNAKNNLVMIDHNAFMHITIKILEEILNKKNTNPKNVHTGISSLKILKVFNKQDVKIN